MDERHTWLDTLPRDRFWPLPTGRCEDGSPRRVGVEIEFSGLTEAEAAGIVERLWGGTRRQSSPHRMEVADSRFGDIKVELDTALTEKADTRIEHRLLDLSREVIPVEIVLPPLPERDLPEIGTLIDALDSAGARGTEDGVLLAFGIHLNPEVPALTADHLVPVVRSFAFLERWFRVSDRPSLARRILPFIDPWPRAFVDRCAEGRDWTTAELCETYLELAASRNHGLDLLPLLEHLYPERLKAALPDHMLKGGRPTWHYRLPETATGAEGWSFAYEWNRWVLVERVAADPSLLGALSEAWRAYSSAPMTMRSDWAAEVERLLEGAALWHG